MTENKIQIQLQALYKNCDKNVDVYNIHNDNNKILFTMVRSFNKNTSVDSKKHLICSRFNFSCVLPFEKLNQGLTPHSQRINIVYLFKYDKTENLYTREPLKKYTNLNIYLIDINLLFTEIFNTNIISEIIGHDSKHKELDNMLANTLFIR